MKTKAKRKTKAGDGQMPDTVNVRDPQGNIRIISYRELKEHEISIIEDNIGYGLLHPEYSDEEIRDYENQARREWNSLKRKLRENPDLVLALDATTERYVPSTT